MARLPKAYTCFNQLNLCINYNLNDESEKFIFDIHTAFSQCTIGFNESVLHEGYLQTFVRPKDLESSMYLNFLIILSSLIFCFYFCIIFYLI